MFPGFLLVFLCLTVLKVLNVSLGFFAFLAGFDFFNVFNRFDCFLESLLLFLVFTGLKHFSFCLDLCFSYPCFDVFV